jgi:hypothetical protein
MFNIDEETRGHLKSLGKTRVHHKIDINEEIKDHLKS